MGLSFEVWKCWVAKVPDLSRTTTQVRTKQLKNSSLRAYLEVVRVRVEIWSIPKLPPAQFLLPIAEIIIWTLRKTRLWNTPSLTASRAARVRNARIWVIVCIGLTQVENWVWTGYVAIIGLIKEPSWDEHKWYSLIKQAIDWKRNREWSLTTVEYEKKHCAWEETAKVGSDCFRSAANYLLNRL